MRRLLVLLLALLLPTTLLAACGDDDDPEGAATSEDGGTDDGAEPADETEDTTGDGDGDGSDSDPDLEPLLLTADELGTGWSVEADDGDEGDDSDDDLPECFQAIEEQDDEDAIAEAEVSLVSEEDLPAFFEDLSRYEGSLDDEFELLTSILDDCGEFTMDMGDGVVADGAIERAELPDYGDASAGWVMSFDASGDVDTDSGMVPMQLHFEFVIAIVAVDDIAMTLGYMSLGEDLTAEAEPVFRRAVDKVEAGTA